MGIIILMLARIGSRRRHGLGHGIILAAIAISTVCLAAIGFADDKAKESPGHVIELSAKESEVLPIVTEVAADSIVRGTYVYERDKTLTGAMPAKTSSVFGEWQGPGKVFYKVLAGALAPRHFQDSADIGTITVRYVVQSVSEDRTRVRIDAIFIEDGRRKAHLSDGTVETSESKAIQDKLQEIQLAQQKAAEELKSRQEEAAAQASALRERQDQQEEAARLDAAQSSTPRPSTTAPRFAAQGGAASERVEYAVKVRAVSEGGGFAIAGSLHRTRRPDRYPVLVRRGDHRRTPGMAAPRSSRTAPMKKIFPQIILVGSLLASLWCVKPISAQDSRFERRFPNPKTEVDQALQEIQDFGQGAPADSRRIC